MTDARWFRLLVQAIGVLLLGMGTPYLLSYIGGIVYEFANQPSHEATKYAWSRAPGLLAYSTQTWFGVYLLRGGDRLVEWCLRRSIDS